MFKKNGPGQCCCACYSLTDPFLDLNLQNSEQGKQQVKWFTLEQQWNNILPETIKNDFPGIMSIEPDTPARQYAVPCSAENFPDKVLVPNDGNENKYKTLEMGRFEFEIDIESNTSAYIGSATSFFMIQIGPDGGVRFGSYGQVGGGNVWRCYTDGEIKSNPGSVHELRIRIETTEWILWEPYASFFDTIGGSVLFWIPLNIYTQNITDDPKDDEQWNWIWSGATLRSQVSRTASNNTDYYPADFSVMWNSDTAGRAAITKDVQIVNRAEPPGESQNTVEIRNWRWEVNDIPYGLPECPTSRDVLWPGFDWERNSMNWSFDDMASSLFGFAYRLAAQVPNYSTWQYFEPFVDSATVLVEGKQYGVKLGIVTVSFFGGTLVWTINTTIQESFNDPSPVPPTPIRNWNLRGVVPLHKPEEQLWPQVVNEDRHSIIECDDPIGIGLQLYNAVFGSNWSWTFSTGSNL